VEAEGHPASIRAFHGRSVRIYGEFQVATDQGTFGVGQSPSLVLSAYLALSKVRQLPTLCRADAVQQSHSFLDATVVANVSMRP